MWKSGAFTSPREVETSIRCRRCGGFLQARRSCHEAYLHCERCRVRSEVREYLEQMDTALENFLESLHCDRI